MGLYKRQVFNELETYIGTDNVIVLHGARQVGKTHILLYIQNFLEAKNQKVFYYDLEFPELLETLNKGVDSFLLDLSNKGYTGNMPLYVIIDEIQYLDNPSSFLKLIADHHKNIHLIVSGSSTFDIKTKFKDSLVGRTVNFEVFPLTFGEFLKFKNFSYELGDEMSSYTLSKIRGFYFEFVKYGAYPKIVLENNELMKKKYLLQMIDTYIRKDIRDLGDITDIKKFNSLLKVLASQSAQILNMKSLSRETNISLPTLQKYLSILEETFVIKLVTPYSKSPSVEISKNPKIFFYDSGLQSLLWTNHFQDTVLGSVFETNIFGELVKKHGRENVNFWRNKQQKEIDFIIDQYTKLLPIEVKLNFSQFEMKSVNVFLKRYKIDKFNVVGLNGEKNKDYFIYPWEI